MREISEIAPSVYVRWPEELNYDEVLERLVEARTKLTQGLSFRFGTDWDPNWGNGAGHWTIMFRGEKDDDPVELKYGKGVKIEFGHAKAIERIGWRNPGVIRVGEAYRVIGRAYGLDRIDDLYELWHTHNVSIEGGRLYIDGYRVHEDYGTAVELVGLKKLLYEEGCPSMTELKAKILPSYDDIVVIAPNTNRKGN